MESRCAETVTVWVSNRVVTVGLIWVQMRKGRDRVGIGSVKIDLRLRSTQSTFAICTSEALGANRGTVRQTLGGGGAILSRNVVFTVEVRPLDLA